MKNPTFSVAVGKDFWPGNYSGEIDARGMNGKPTNMEVLDWRFVQINCSVADAWRFAVKMTAAKIYAFYLAKRIAAHKVV